MSLNHQLISRLKNQEAEFIHFVDISSLHEKQTRGFPSAILFGISLSAKYLLEITRDPFFVENMIQENKIEEDEFNCKEIFTDRLADELTDFLKQSGFAAFSQSEKNLEATGNYNLQEKSTPLPHKTIAGLAGFGWIGKHNLLVTPKFGSALSMCTVLTDAPLETVLKEPLKSKCGNCTICKNVCATNAITGNSWNKNTSRNQLVDVQKCTTCLQCLAMCPFTRKYMEGFI